MDDGEDEKWIALCRPSESSQPKQSLLCPQCCIVYKNKRTYLADEKNNIGYIKQESVHEKRE